MDPDDFNDSLLDVIPTYGEIDIGLGTLNEFELDALVGAIVGEFVNRGATSEAAVGRVVEAATGGQIGSDMFDEEYPA